MDRPKIPEDLPIAAHAPAIEAAIRAHPVVIVKGETGCGKTTQLPKICLAAARGKGGMIALTQPRRIAARTVCARIAQELGDGGAGAVAYQVRFDDRSTKSTRIKVLTDGILLAELRVDGLLRRYDTIIVDEAHERTLNIDFLLGCLTRILRRRDDLKVVVASATIDAARFAAHFDSAPVIEVPGRLHPIEVKWMPLAEDEAGTNLVGAVVDAVDERLDAQEGDGLVFLPGEREIAEVSAALEGRLNGRASALPLYARLSSAEQDRALAAQGGRRVILATNIAETSLTVPRVRFVVDTGLARVLRYSPKARLQRLPIERISQASAHQRAGRCGRVAPGVCVRLYSEATLAESAAWPQPEIQRVSLASVLLQMASLGLGELERFPFIDAPGTRAVAEGRATLIELGALSASHRLTKAGSLMARLPIDPRLARTLLEARRGHCLAEALVVAAALSVADPRERPLERSMHADLAHAAWRDPDSDLASILRLWRAWRAQSDVLGSSALKRWCRDSFLSSSRLREWSEIHRQLSHLVVSAWLRGESASDARAPADAPMDALHRALLAGFVSHAAQRTPEGEYQLATGQSFTVHGSSSLARSHSRWIVAAEIIDTGRRLGRTVVRIHPQWIEQVAPHLVHRAISEPHWVAERGQAAAWERVTLGSLVVSPRRRVSLGPRDPDAARALFIQGALVEEQVRGAIPEFMARNRALRNSIEVEGARRRCVLLADELRRFEFFAQRLPASMHSWPSLVSWIREDEASRSALLTMSRRDLVTEGEADSWLPDPALIDVGGVAHRVTHVHAPGLAHDGATLSVPLEAASQLDPRALSWGAPEVLEELCASMIRSLPKHLRQRLSPLAEVAEGAALALADREGEFGVRLAAHCTGIALTSVRPSDFDLGKVEPHLRLRVEVTYGGRVVDADRDIRAVARRVRARSLEAFAVLAPELAPSLQRSEVLEWDDSSLPAEIPRSIDAPSGSPVAVLHPALVDAEGHKGGPVMLRVFPDQLSGRRQMRQGIVRLLSWRISDRVKDLAVHDPSWEQLALDAVAHGLGEAELLADLADAVAIAVTDRLAEFPRTRDSMQAVVQQAIDGLWLRVGEVLRCAHACFVAVETPVPALLRDRVATIFPPRALRRLGARALERAPRRLAAQAIRARRALIDPARERADSAIIAHWSAQARLARESASTWDEWVAALDFEDLVEEFAVALFAQELGTVRSVSAPRIERAAAQLSALVVQPGSGQE